MFARLHIISNALAVTIATFGPEKTKSRGTLRESLCLRPGEQNLDVNCYYFFLRMRAATIKMPPISDKPIADGSGTKVAVKLPD